MKSKAQLLQFLRESFLVRTGKTGGNIINNMHKGQTNAIVNSILPQLGISDVEALYQVYKSLPFSVLTY